MALLQIAFVIIAVASTAMGQTCVIPPEFPRAGATALAGQVLRISRCPYNVPNALGVHTCTASGAWVPPIGCVAPQPVAPQPVAPQPALPATGFCVVPAVFQQSLGRTTIPAGSSLRVTFCPNGPTGTVHTCIRGNVYSPEITCQFGTPTRPIAPVAPRPQGINPAILWLLLQNQGGLNFNICSIFSFLSSCQTNSTSSGRKRRHADLRSFMEQDKLAGGAEIFSEGF